MNVDISKVRIRLAMESDYEGVLGIIPNLYNGKDYMPVCYHNMLRDPRRFLFIADLEGEIIGLEMYYVVDGDQCMVGEAGRIKRRYRRRRISQLLFTQAITHIRQRYPRVRYLSYTSQSEVDNTKVLYSPALRSLDYRHIVRISSENHMILQNAVSSSDFAILHKKLPMNQTKVLTPSEALTSLDKLMDNNCILTEHAWLVNYEPFRPLHSNHLTITHSNTRGHAVVITTIDEHGDISAVSFGVVTLIKEGVMFTVDFYCDKSKQGKPEGNVLLSSHLLKHLLLFTQVRGDFRRLVLDVVLSKDLNGGEVLACLSGAGVRDFEVVHRKKRVYCVEVHADMFFTPKL